MLARQSYKTVAPVKQTTFQDSWLTCSRGAYVVKHTQLTYVASDSWGSKSFGAPNMVRLCVTLFRINDLYILIYFCVLILLMCDVYTHIPIVEVDLISKKIQHN